MNILLTSFNRPDALEQVLNEINRVEYAKLFISIDAPKTNDLVNISRNKKVRSLIADYAKNNNKVELIIYENNQGCRKAVSQSISKCFTQVDDLIILEDDCLPLPGFFNYCQRALDEFRENYLIGSISSQSFLFEKYHPNGDVFLSKYHHCWGWATWKRSWIKYEDEVSSFSEFIGGEKLEKLSSGEIGFKQYWRRIYKNLVENEFDSWAYRWLFSCWKNQLLSIVPRYSLVKNIGFDSSSTHTNNEPMGMQKNYNIKWDADSINFKIPLIRDEKAEVVISNHHYHCWIDCSKSLSILIKIMRNIKILLMKNRLKFKIIKIGGFKDEVQQR
jgi:hypothetical protein